jgi:hypothetical protein
VFITLVIIKLIPTAQQHQAPPHKNRTTIITQSKITA